MMREAPTISSLDLSSPEALMIGLQYNGLNNAEIQLEVVRKTGGSRSRLAELLTICIMTGNNYSKRLDARRVMDSAVGDRAKAVLTGYDVMQRRQGPTTLTPARIMAAFSPVVLCMRREMNRRKVLPETNIQSRTGKVFCDLALAPMSEEIPIIKDFLESFAKVLLAARKRVDKDNKETEEQAVARMHEFRAIAVNSYNTDPFVKQIKQAYPAPPDWVTERIMFMFGFVNA
jgi:hypothetical protein